jgi:hypothetical protein
MASRIPIELERIALERRTVVARGLQDRVVQLEQELELVTSRLTNTETEWQDWRGQRERAERERTRLLEESAAAGMAGSTFAGGELSDTLVALRAMARETDIALAELTVTRTVLAEMLLRASVMPSDLAPDAVLASLEQGREYVTGLEPRLVRWRWSVARIRTDVTDRMLQVEATDRSAKNPCRILPAY